MDDPLFNKTIERLRADVRRIKRDPQADEADLAFSRFALDEGFVWLVEWFVSEIGRSGGPAACTAVVRMASMMVASGIITEATYPHVHADSAAIVEGAIRYLQNEFSEELQRRMDYLLKATGGSVAAATESRH